MEDMNNLTHLVASITSDSADFLSVTNQLSVEESTEHKNNILLHDAVTGPRLRMLSTIDKLQRLLLGPVDTIMNKAQPELASLHIIHDFELARAVPLGGSATFQEISRRSGLAEREVRRVMRLAMVDDIFVETEPGVVAHTNASHVLATNESLQDWIDMTYTEVLPAKLNTVKALRSKPSSESSQHSGFSVSQNIHQGFFNYLDMHPERAQKFRSGMKAANERGGFQMYHTVRALCQNNLIAFEGVCVDVGGSNGEAMLELAKTRPDVHCIVQDLPATIARGGKQPENVIGRVDFMSHDFFTTQPVKNADVYLLRNVLHNWSDEKCRKILRFLTPEMNSKSKIVIVDWCLSSKNAVSDILCRKKRAMDMNMLSLTNSREREEDEWRAVIEHTQSDLHLQSIEHPIGSNFSIMYVGLEK